MYNFVFFTDVSDTTMVYKSIGAYKCAHELRAQGYTCLVVDYLHSFTMDEWEKCIAASVGPNTWAVGFSTTFMMNTNVPETDQGIFYTALDDGVFFPQGIDFQKIALDYLRQINSACCVVVGGSKAHQNYNNRQADYVVIGFAETSVVNLARHLSQGAALPNSYRNIWGVTIIDDKMSPDYDFKNSSFEWLATDIVNAKVLPIEIARGCIFKCKFCSYPMNGKHNLDFVRTSEQLQKELQSNYDRFGITYYYIIDDTFNDNEHKIDCILQAVSKLTFQPYFWAYTRLDLIARKPSTMKKLYDIGLRGYYFGIETMDKQAGKIIGKGYNRQRMIETIQNIKATYSDVLLHGSFIIGLPGETLASSKSTADLILSREIPLDTFNFNGLRLFKTDKVTWNSELSEQYVKYGYRQIAESDSNSQHRVDFNWASDITNRDQADALAREITLLGRQSLQFGIPGQVTWGMLNYGQDYTEIQKIKYHELDWHKISKDKTNFLNQYKQNLFAQLNCYSHT